VAAPSQKKLKADILELLNRKKSINQPGRVVAFIVNELKLGDNSSIRVPLITALESLEAEGSIKLERAGSVINAVRLVPAKRAPRTSSTASKPSAPSQQRLPRQSRQPRSAVQSHQPPLVVMEVPSATPAEEASAIEVAPQKSLEVAPVVQARTSHESTPEGPTEKPLLERLVDRVEELKRDLSVSQNAELTTRSKLAVTNGDLAIKDRKLTEANEALEQSNADKARLAEELREAVKQLEESSEMNELLADDNRVLQQRVDDYQHLEQRALRALE